MRESDQQFYNSCNPKWVDLCRNENLYHRTSQTDTHKKFCRLNHAEIKHDLILIHYRVLNCSVFAHVLMISKGCE